MHDQAARVTVFIDGLPSIPPIPLSTTKEVAMNMTTRDPRYPKAEFVDVEPCGFIYLGMTIDPPRRTPLVRRSAERNKAVEKLTAIAQELEGRPEVITARVYRAVVIPPIAGGPRFDAAMLIRTTSPHTIGQVQADDAYHRLDPAFTMTARNIRRFGDTDATREATFLFNHFAARNPDRAVETWEQLTGWFTASAGVDNTTLLRPIHDDSPYALVNYVRLPGGPVRFLLNQFTKPSFYRHVRRPLRANRINTMPVLFRLA